MGLADLFRREKVPAAQIHRITVPEVAESTRLRPYRDPLVLAGKDRGWVYVCVRINARAVAQNPIRLYTKDTRQNNGLKTKAVPGEVKDELFGRSSLRKSISDARDLEEVTDHPILDLLDEVNPITNGFEFVESLSISLDLTGNAFVNMVDAEFGIAELWWLRTQWIEVVPSRSRLIDHYVYKVTGIDEQDIPVEDMLHFREPNPVDAFYGRPPLLASELPADLATESHLYDRALVQNNSVPDVLISVDGQPDEKEERRFQQAYRKRWGRRSKSRGGVGLIGNILGVHRLGLSGREMAFDKGRPLWKEEVCGTFGVPPAMVGNQNTNLANLQGSLVLHARNTVMPRCKKIEQTLNQGLIPRWGNDSLFLAFDNAVPEDRASEREDMKARRASGVSTANEERQKIGWEGLDEPEMDMPHVSNSMRPISEERRQETMQRQDAQAEAARQAASQPGPGNQNGQAPERPAGRGRRQAASLSDWGEKSMVPGRMASRTLRRVIVTTLADMEVEVKSALEAEWLKSSDDEGRIRQKIAAIVGVLQAWKSRLIRRAMAPLEAVVHLGGVQGMMAVGTGGGFNPKADHVIRTLREFTEGFASRVIQVGGERLTETLAEGMKAGETIGQIEQRVANEFTVIRDHRVTRIVRTETQRALNVGAVEGWKQSGVVESKEWLVSSDGCPFCIAAGNKFNRDSEGKAVALGVPFFKKGDTLTADVPIRPLKPGERVEDVPADEKSRQTMVLDYSDVQAPPLHPNCRCTVIPVVREFGE